MGNCTSSKYLAEKSSIISDDEALETVERRLIAEDDGALRSSSPSVTTKVKIKITKRELEKLLGKLDVEDLPVTQLLSRLIDVSDTFEAHHRSWQPSLHTIPELI